MVGEFGYRPEIVAFLKENFGRLNVSPGPRRDSRALRERSAARTEQMPKEAPREKNRAPRAKEGASQTGALLGPRTGN